MSIHDHKPHARAYTWDRGKPSARQGIAIATHSTGPARIFLPTREDAITLATRIVELIDDPTTFTPGEPR